MTWSSNSDDYDTNRERSSKKTRTINSLKEQPQQQQLKEESRSTDEPCSITCPSCGHKIHRDDQVGSINDLPSLPAGMKFDPTDHEILMHLEAKVLLDKRKLHPLIDEFIPTLEGENGICSTHPEKLPGVSKDGHVRHFFHRPSKAYTTGTRKRRKVSTDEEGNETRWHKTGKTRAVYVDGAVKGFKKILVLYTNYGRQKKPEKTNWVMHQYHIGHNEDEREGELVVSKVFYQTQPRQCGSGVIKDSNSFEKSLKNIVPNSIPLVGYEYNNPQLFAYEHESHSGNGESVPPMISNRVVQGEGSNSFFGFASDASKRKTSREI